MADRGNIKTVKRGSATIYAGLWLQGEDLIRSDKQLETEKRF
jgi:hypothetical protein